MKHEDLVIIRTFLTTLESMENPLPESLQNDLGLIVEAVLGSAIGAAEQKTTLTQSEQPSSPVKHSIQELGWTKEKAAEIRHRLASFSEDWEVPGMEVYDDL
jgi:hypothetical protein